MTVYKSTCILVDNGISLVATMQTGSLEEAVPLAMTGSPQPLLGTTFKENNDIRDTTSDLETEPSDPDVCKARRYNGDVIGTVNGNGNGDGNGNDNVSHLDTELVKGQEQSANESVRSWLQRITAMQTEMQRKQKHNVAEYYKNNMVTQHTTNSTNMATQQQAMPTQPTRVVKYQDLPYMGEMTLDNSKPRRGRKPKKADICHLIYKNYGTIFPGTPKSLVDTQNETKKLPSKQKDPTEPVQRTNVQNRIISSLLEKRLTQESLRNKELLLKTALKPSEPDQNEPLNLCIRDLNQLKIRLLRKHGNVYQSDSILNEVKSEPVSDDDVEFVDSSSPESVKQTELSPVSEESLDVSAPGGYVYWPNAGVFIHPMALHSHLMYYQQMAANNNYTLPNGPRPSPETSTPPTPTPSTPPPPPHPPTMNRELRKLIPKNSVRQPQQKTASDESERSATPDLRTKRIASQSGSAPTKRKRSAIFIPPIPTENQTNPATEVSICKFKFTGGAKPSLQEKKMLSVDSGGNFRYYSGTGDKSMRGYEFFPRETLQQQAAAGSSHGSGTGAFLQASGEKMPMLPIPGDQKNVPPEFMFSPDTALQPVASMPDLGTRHRKRKTRKSLQREKLEQTFKEKGFLIQTQQLESAEGATYCKFRQLRKFTRYLFRSWKDYLPGSVRELQEGDKSEEEEEGGEHEEHVADDRIIPSDMTNM